MLIAVMMLLVNAAWVATLSTPKTSQKAYAHAEKLKAQREEMLKEIEKKLGEKVAYLK